MERVSLSKDIEFSRIVYGLWRLGDDPDHSVGHVQAKLESCLEQGITTFDQADIYGDYASEEILGNTLKAAPELRDRMEIVTKCDIMLLSDRRPGTRVKHYDTSADHIRTSVDNSLKNMGIDVIDVLLIHRPDPLMDHVETGGVLDELIAAGKIRGAGVSNFRPWESELLQSGMKNLLITNQLEISLAARDSLSNGDLAWLQRHGIRPMAWSPLGGGSLMTETGTPLAGILDTVAERNGVDRAAVAVAWLLAHPSGIIPVLGTNNLYRIGVMSKAMDVDMDRQTWFEILEAACGHEVA